MRPAGEVATLVNRVLVLETWGAEGHGCERVRCCSAGRTRSWIDNARPGGWGKRTTAYLKLVTSSGVVLQALTAGRAAGLDARDSRALTTARRPLPR